MKIVFSGEQLTYFILPHHINSATIETIDFADPVVLANGQTIVVTNERARLEKLVGEKLQPMTMVR